MGLTAIWCINVHKQIWVRNAFTKEVPGGITWAFIATPVGYTAKDVSVSEIDNTVYLITTDGSIWWRTRIPLTEFGADWKRK